LVMRVVERQAGFCSTCKDAVYNCSSHSFSGAS
jgi:hypothetical protein